jgi:AmmeMemoRadiSam system protein B
VTRDLGQIQRAFELNFGEQIDLDIIQDIVAKLNEACLLDNDRSQVGMAELIQSYRALPNRPPALAGLGYPADPLELDVVFQAYGDGDDLNGWNPWRGRGIISPHIDYSRGGPIYSRVWRRAQEAVLQADLVLIFGTDHNGSPGRITLTQKAYATPYGVIPTDLDIVNSLAETLGPEAYIEELHHRKEHSVELSAVWLHHIMMANHSSGERSCPMIPILCGSFHHFLIDDHHPADDLQLTNFIESLKDVTDGKRVLVVASVDLAHVGPNFGDDFIMDDDRREKLTESDAALMKAITLGDVDRFYDEIAKVEDRNRICGFSSIYLMLRYLGATRGQVVAYEHCPADAEDTSLVSICGLLLE